MKWVIRMADRLTVTALEVLGLGIMEPMMKETKVSFNCQPFSEH